METTSHQQSELEKQEEFFPNDQVSQQSICINVNETLMDVDPQQECQVDPENSPESKALQNPIIIKEIFKYLPPSEYLHHRLINRHFLSIYNSNSFLSSHHRSPHLLTFIFDPSTSSYLSPRGSLAQLTSCLQSSTRFPCTNFSFSQGSLSSLDVPPFLSCYGLSIHKLTLNLSSDPPHSFNHETVIHLRNFLFLSAPNLHQLDFEHISFDSTNETPVKLFPDPSVTNSTIKFPFLKILSISYNARKTKDFLMDIIQAADQLQVLEGFNGSEWLDALAGVNKLHTIKRFSLALNGSYVEPYRKLAPRMGPLKEIDFNTIRVSTSQARWPGIAETVNRLMETSKDSLESVRWFDELGWLPGLTLQPCPGVTRLTLRNRDRPERHRLMPVGHSLSYVFPNLVSLKIYGRPTTRLWEESGIDQLMTLQQLVVGWDLDKLTMERLVPLFPNVTTFEGNVTNVNECPGVVKWIWKWEKCEKISLNVDCGQRDSDLCRRVDSAVTGISEDVCEELKINPNFLGMEEVGNLRMRPSIVDAKCLKVFQLTAVEKPGDFQRTEIISHVAGIFGFQPMRRKYGLEVVLHAHDNVGGPVDYGALSLLKPYVDSWS